MGNLDRRFGVFRISSNTIKSDPESVMQIMGKCVVVQAEHLFALGEVSYTAMSPLFRETEIGEMPPKYMVSVIDGDVTAEEVS